jgi:hypothetical protein
VNPAQVALAWLLSRPAVTAPIIGATKLTHLDDAIAATDLVLNEKETERLEAPYRPTPSPAAVRPRLDLNEDLHSVRADQRHAGARRHLYERLDDRVGVGETA